jgi:hypothetical protein
MLAWLRRKWRDYQDGRRLARQIDPETFRNMACELRELAQVAGQLWPDEEKFQEKLKRIRTDMEQVDRLASRPEFKRLSPQKRMQLRDSLVQSREQLLETVQTAPSPTTMLQ